MRIRCLSSGSLPSGVRKLEGLPAVQEEPRGILSKPLVVAQSSTGSMVIWSHRQCGWI